MKHTKTYILLLLCLYLYSCMKDKGNYDYKPVNLITINGIDSSYIVEYGSRFKITPQLSFSEDETGDTSNYSFQWIAAYPLGYSSYPDTISLAKNLDMDMTLEFGSWHTYYRVTDKRTGIFKDFPFTLTVSSASYEGWLLLCDPGDGSSQLAMVSYIGGKDTLYGNILEKMGSAYPTLGKPGFVESGHSYINEPANGTVAVFLANGDHAGILGLDTLEYEPKYDLKYVMSIPEPITDYTDANLKLSTYSGLLYAKGNLYTVGSSSINGPVNTIDNGSQYFTPSKWIAVSKPSGWKIVFDQSTGTFLRQVGNTCLYFQKGELFDFTTGKELLFMTGTVYNGEEVVAILKDAQLDKMYLARFTKSGTQNYYNEITGEDILQATHFAFSPDLGYLFYNVEGKVYEYDPILKKSFLMQDYSDQKISYMGFEEFAMTYPSSPNAERYINYSKKLIVCSYKEGAPKNSGQFDLYTVPDINQPIKIYKSFKGVPKIADVAYRER
ncbi:hypothetical protein COR50_19035 [Chitinophaga caeni]|uniref:PKD-like family protein n=1 Tax=Chitinophaga caeni TaxID=2029983 RepID=A0A291QYS3_9BACT|nr:PKD-like family lipoprotein [Chitinophaga caeni]ATL49095.1 hypothetical protein COR50_19035 [Chitinophaga caeni]